MTFGMILGAPLVPVIVLASQKRRKTIPHRLGLGAIPEDIRQNRGSKSRKRPFWVHALSVGEVVSAIPLVLGLKDRFRSVDIVLSVSTQTAYKIANERLTEHVKGIFFFPYDFVFSVKRIAKKVNPALVIIVETDIWPNFLFEMKRRNVPVILVNTRLSNRSFSGYRRLSFFMQPVFATFSKICTQTSEDAERFMHLGIPESKITITGNVKFEQKYEKLTQPEENHFKRLLNVAPSQMIFLAGSTHNGEESILLDAFSRMKKTFPDLLLIAAPRDPQRAGSVFHMCTSAGWSAALWKTLKQKESGMRLDIVVIDTVGLLTRLYAMADIAFVGGSLANCGGHNPLEPAAFSKPILFGPDMSDFQEISNMLLASGGAFQVYDADGIYKAGTTLLENRNKAKEIGKHAFDVLCANRGAVEKVLKEVESFL